MVYLVLGWYILYWDGVFGISIGIVKRTEIRKGYVFGLGTSDFISFQKDNINNSLLKLLSVSFWAQAELPHLLVTELVQVCVHLEIMKEISSISSEITAAV